MPEFMTNYINMPLCHRLLLTAIILLQGCAYSTHSAREIASSAGFNRQVVSSGVFDHVVFSNQAFSSIENARLSQSVLHIYIEGDGTPWRDGIRIAENPTPKNPLALKLMAKDSQPAIYLGRPCYFGLHQSAGCHSRLWTGGRYSEEVIHSMSVVLEQTIAEYSDSAVILIGHSGGAAIAALLAQRNPDITALVTVSGNLDTDLWTSTRGFLPLSDSLNPTAANYSKELIQIHLIGEIDTIVPPSVIYSFTDIHGGQVWRYSDFDHACCWEKEWPTILSQIESTLKTALERKGPE